MDLKYYINSARKYFNAFEPTSKYFTKLHFFTFEEVKKLIIMSVKKRIHSTIINLNECDDNIFLYKNDRYQVSLIIEVQTVILCDDFEIKNVMVAKNSDVITTVTTSILIVNKIRNHNVIIPSSRSFTFKSYLEFDNLSENRNNRVVTYDHPNNTDMYHCYNCIRSDVFNHFEIMKNIFIELCSGEKNIDIIYDIKKKLEADNF